MSAGARAAGRGLKRYFTELDPRLAIALGPALVLSLVLFTRAPGTNFVFDEQEALLANPYVNGDELGFWDAFKRDFWGLPPERTIGSYRPLPNFIWRGVWHLGKTPFWAHLATVLLHGLNAALLTALVFRCTRSRRTAWLSGAVFVCAAILTEAVSQVVGIADVLAGTALLVSLHALAAPLWAQVPLIAIAIFFGLLSKESGITALVLLPWSAWMLAPLLAPEKPRRLLRVLLSGLGTAAGLVAYTYLRRHSFPVAATQEANLPVPAPGAVQEVVAAFLRWFQQPKLPRHPLNNPLLEASDAERIAGALSIFARSTAQVLFPWRLSGDYSFAEEPIPKDLITAGSLSGGLLLLALPLAGLVIGLWPRARANAALLLTGWGALWVAASYFPVSNLAVLLPTVRAERLWYVPVIASSVMLGCWWVYALERWRSHLRYVAAALAVFFLAQVAQARRHASDYNNDLAFWRATARASPDSAKAHLNYGVMLGARGRLQQRLEENARALAIAPDWPMANVYYADTLCRLKRHEEAWRYYRRGWELGPREQSLVALGLQCMWDNEQIEPRKAELRDLIKPHKGTWLDFLVKDILSNGKRNKGVDPRYRPRSYNEGPRGSKAKEAASASAKESAPATTQEAASATIQGSASATTQEAASATTKDAASVTAQ